MMYQQVQCEQLYDNGDRGGPINSCTTRLHVWVEADRVHKGSVVTFKETGDVRWRVTETYGTRTNTLNQKWGLNLPKSQRTEA